MTRIFIFAGTTEGRELSEKLSQSGYEITASVATEYGAKLLPKSEKITVLQGRLDSEQMVLLLSQKEYAFVIDATHPFATEVSKEIKKACGRTKIPYLRLARDTEKAGNFVDSQNFGKNLLYFDEVSSAAEWLESQSGRIFVTTGSKELPKICEKISDRSRLTVRVLPSKESIRLCGECGMKEGQIIAVQGPFSEEANRIQFEKSGAKILLTKESGSKGGYFEKICAAEGLSMKIAVIKNPEREALKSESGERKDAFLKNDIKMSEIFHTVEEICAEIGEVNII